MVKHFFLAHFFIALVFVTCICAMAAEPTYEEVAHKKFQEAIPADGSGVAVLVAKDGKIVFQGGYGLADVEHKTPVTTDTRFRIGSVTKQFTAAAILKLAEEGKLSLDDTLDKYYPDFPRGNDVTIKQLLTHTSGIHSYTDKKEFLGRVKEPIEPAKLIEWFRNDLPDFVPGKGFHYNNSAYFLLGEIAAKVSGKTFATYLKETFLEPLGMKNSGIFENAHAPENMAVGYSLNGEKLEPALNWDMSWAGGAGAMYSTVGDLFLWNEALYNGKVLNEASFNAAIKQTELPDDVDGICYGYGLILSELKRMPAIGHGGGLNGWSCDLLRLPNQHCTVVVLTNALPGPPKVTPAALSRLMAEKLLVEEIKSLTPIAEDKSIDPKTFGDFVGHYDYKNATMEVTVEGDLLFAQLTGQSKMGIFPRSKDHFFWKDADADVVFLRDDNGKVIAARHTQAGNVFRAPKLAGPPIQLTSEQLEPFIGEYQYGPNAVLTTTREGAQLFAQLTGQPKFPIFPKAENEFVWRVVAARVQFVKGEDGKITKAVHHQNGTSFDAPKIK